MQDGLDGSHAICPLLLPASVCGEVAAHPVGHEGAAVIGLLLHKRLLHVPNVHPCTSQFDMLGIILLKLVVGFHTIIQNCIMMVPQCRWEADAILGVDE